MSRAQWIALALLLGLAAGWLALGFRLEGRINRIAPVPLPEVGPRARSLHATSFVADLHADSLLFGRDLLERASLGHVDLPRLRAGGVALQVFGLPTRVRLETTGWQGAGGQLDALTLAAIAQASPAALLGPTDRARYRARGLRRMIERSQGALRAIETRADLERLVSDRATGANAVGALLAIEGAHALESHPANLSRLFDAGYRMIGLAHFFDNDYAGSAHGEQRGGLTPLGRETLREMERLGITLDVAHLSPRALDEALALATRPAVFSHGGVRATCDNRRNLSDAQIRRIADGGGVVGIGYWPMAVCGRAPEDVARAIAHAVRLVGPDHVALGSDYDGGTTVGFDTSRLAVVTQALVERDLSDETIRKVLGTNVLRVLRENLPVDD